MRKKTIIVVATVIIISSVATATIFLSSGENSLLPFRRTEPGTPSYDYLKGATIIPYQGGVTVYNEITGDYRPEYPITPEQYESYFGNLPPFPQDFFDIATLVYDGRVTDYTRLGEQYWKQPEFFTGWYASFESLYLGYDPAMWTPEGYGMFPLIKEVTIPAGSTATVSAFLRTGFGTNSYQGVIFRPSLPSTAKAITGHDIFEQPLNAKQYISTRIVTPNNPIFESFKDTLQTNNVQEEDWFVILRPTYQRIPTSDGTQEIGFYYDWIRQFDIEIEIAGNTPKGMYVVAVDPVTPCFHINQEFYLSATYEYYGKYYWPAGRMLRSNTPHFQVIFEVI